MILSGGFVGITKLISLGRLGSFLQPPPGEPTSSPYDSDHLRMGVKLDMPGDLNDDGTSRENRDVQTAMANFRLCVIRPMEVERTVLADGADARRWVWKWEGEDGPDGLGNGRWGEGIELWP